MTHDHEVANGILQSGKDAELGILPSGTGGDFRRTIKMPQETREAARSLQTGVTKTIDVGRVTFQNFQNETVSRYFLNVSSFGLSAAINKKVKEKDYFDWLPIGAISGRAKYALSTLEKFLDTNYLTVRVRIDDGEEKSLNSLNFCVCNSRYLAADENRAECKLTTDFSMSSISATSRGLKSCSRPTRFIAERICLEEFKSSLAQKIEVSPINNQEIHIETDGELPENYLPYLK